MSANKTSVDTKLIMLLDLLSFKEMTSEQADTLSTDELHEIIADAYQRVGALSWELSDDTE